MYRPVAPIRVLDTRTTGRLARDSTVVVDTRLGDVAAAAVQVTATGAAGPGFLTTWNGEGDRPPTSVLNLRHADDVNGNFVIVPLRAGTFAVYTSEEVDLVVDVVGSATSYTASTPQRLVDTRSAGGTPAGSTVVVPTGLPAGTRSAAVQITVADTTGPGFLTAWSGVGARPDTSVLNHGPAGDVDGNFAIVPLAPDATFRLYTLAATGIIVDLLGTLDGYVPTTPQRVVDTRQTGRTPAGSAVRVETNLNPAVTAVAVQITAADTAGAGHLTAWDGVGAPPAISSVDYDALGNAEGNFMIVPVIDGAFSVFTTADAGIAVDVMGHTGAPLASYDVPDPNPSTLLPADVPIGAPDLTHRYGPHHLQLLDVFRGDTGRTLVWLHGGGWEGGDRSLAPDGDMGHFNRVPRRLRAEGWTVVSAGYRLSPEADLEMIVADFHAALGAVGEHAVEWSVDRDRIVVGGFSAGGHIAALGTTAINDGAFDPPADLPRVRGILAQDGNLMSSLFAAAVPPGTLDPAGNDLSPAPAIARLLSCPGNSYPRCTPERIAQSDVVTYSDASDPPLYLIGGTHSVIPLHVQTDTRDLVRAAGQVVVFDAVDTGPEWARMHDVRGLNWAALRAFLDAVTT